MKSSEIGPVHSVFKPPSGGGQYENSVWTGLHGCADALAIAEAFKADDRFYLVVTEDTHAALRLEHEIGFFLGNQGSVLHFPDWETLPYDSFSPLPEIVSERLRTLVELSSIRKGILLTPVSTLMQRLGPRTHIHGRTFCLKKGGRLQLQEMRNRLESVGYHCVQQVLQHGEFAVRGSILDLFPMGSTVPYRVELFDEEIESIRVFDPETQKSDGLIESVNLFPAREFPFDEAAIKHFRQRFRERFPESSSKNIVYQEISKGIAVAGIEYYLPLFVDSTESLFDYLPKATRIFLHGSVGEAADRFSADTLCRYEQRLNHLDRPPLPVEQLFLSKDEWGKSIEGYGRVSICCSPDHSASGVCFPSMNLPDLAVDAKQREAYGALSAFLEQFEGRALLVAETAGHREALLEGLGRSGIRPRVLEDWSSFRALSDPLCLVVAPMDHGLWLTDERLVIITETQLSGERVQQRRRRKTASSQRIDQVLKNLEELEMGAPVVHQDHGVGRYRGLTRLEVGGIETEFLTLEYANADTLYVPVASLHLIGRYSGAGADTAPLHRLGGEQWQKAKRKALERVRDVAAELLDIYAKRAARGGRGLENPGVEYYQFAAGFPFEETPDQESAIQQVLEDLTSSEPMDRVVCGDVGFGKTEVAMRAAFLAVQNGCQVAVLVPTTLLAQQHFQNFRDRYADWPIQIESLSRFVGKKQQERVISDLADGRVDIIIGTHKLLQKEVVFKRLGLVIVDEEQRFGVSQKEHFKKLRSEIDFLTLTATPIPRTLNMAMSGLRDISIIATPPPNRHAIKTFICQWDGALIEEAILREIKRGGQVYFLHNKIETMEKMARELESLVPMASIGIAHGQMPERELEAIMRDFYHQRFNLLLCTTIIESGIDIPTANTIIINRADQLGLSQLHQIRGRVGRSHHRAYAYLVTPPESLITSDAKKRLEAIQASGELGAGFMLSSHDLEIRGAGELLGDEQSGQIQEIGLTLYTELLEKAVKAQRSGQPLDIDALPQDVGAEVDLQCPALIPDAYIPDVHSRLVIYKRIANAQSDEDLWSLQVELIDRFGLLPDQTKTLFAVTRLKLKSAVLGVKRIEAGLEGGRLLFHPNPSVDPIQIIGLIQQQGRMYRLDGPDKLRFVVKLDSSVQRVEFLEKLLDQLGEPV